MEQLEAEHHPDEIRARIVGQDHSYLGDAILGAMDGGVTTFAVIAGVAGGGFDSQVILVLGLAKLFADGFSMAASNFLQTRSQHEQIEEARQTEREHIRHIPEGERREIRQIFAQKGFEGDILDSIVETLSQDEEQWIDIMLSQELGLPREAPNPMGAAGATFGAFLVVGFLPLLPFLIPGLTMDQAFWISGGITAAAFLGVGVIKGLVLKRPVLKSGIQTLLVGSGAAVLAYLVSYWLRQRYGVG
ncbi:MAG: VIT1/CCC1 transporter family protein [Anaerolineae bacterium]|nr:VIT1/CCC1 transporter family protein [Anaerolineae bacterium]